MDSQQRISAMRRRFVEEDEAAILRFVQSFASAVGDSEPESAIHFSRGGGVASRASLHRKPTLSRTSVIRIARRRGFCVAHK